MPSLQNILDIAIPLITFFLMTVVGMDLTADDFKKVRSSPRSFVVGTLGQYLLPIVALITLKILRPTQEITAGMVLIASAPGGGISNYYSYIARVNVALSVVLTAVSCLAAVVTMPILLKLFEFVLGKNIDFQMPLKILFIQLLFLLVLPVLLGTFIRNSYPSFVARYDKALRRVGFVALAALIGFILFQTKELIIRDWQQIGQAAALFILLSMILGYLCGLVFRLNRKDAFTILIEFGVRNVAIATTAAVVFLKRTEFAAFAATYFLVEAILILSTIFAMRRYLAQD